MKGVRPALLILVAVVSHPTSSSAQSAIWLINKSGETVVCRSSATGASDLIVKIPAGHQSSIPAQMSRLACSDVFNARTGVSVTMGPRYYFVRCVEDCPPGCAGLVCLVKGD